MKNDTLKQIIEQIKKYELTESFSDVDEFKKWASKLNSTQINNFLSLDIDFEEISELKHLLIDSDLLNCQDYKKRVLAPIFDTLSDESHIFYAFISIYTCVNNA